MPAASCPTRRTFYLPQEEVAAAIQKHFDMSPEMAETPLKDLPQL